MPNIHPSAVVSPTARVHDTAIIGPFCTVGDAVEIGAGTRLVSHVVVDGQTRVGENNTIFPFATLGLVPQDLKYAGEASRLVVGDNNQIREHVTIHLGTAGDAMETRLGSNNLLMVGVHVAHDCVIGNSCVFANNATLAGHVQVADHVTIGGLAAVHQFVHIGTQSMVGGMTGVEADVIPYGLVMGNRAYLEGLNLVGLQRRGFAKDEISALRAVYKNLFHGEGTFAERVAVLAASQPTSELVKSLLAFVTRESRRGLCHPALSS